MPSPANPPRLTLAAAPLHPGGGDANRVDIFWRLLFTLAALLVYVMGMNIPLPGCNVSAFLPGGLFPMRMYHPFEASIAPFVSVFALGVMPYIWALVSMHLLALASERLRALKNGDVVARKQFNTYTRYLALLIAGYQAYAIAIGLEGQPTSYGSVVVEPGYVFRALTVATLSAGTMFLVWLGDEITRRGIGNGTSLLLFASLAPTLPLAIAKLVELNKIGAIATTFVLPLLLLPTALIAAIITLERTHRRLFVMAPTLDGFMRNRNQITQEVRLKLNAAGIIPFLITSSFLAPLSVLTPILQPLLPVFDLTFLRTTWPALRPFSHVLTFISLAVLISYIGRALLYDPRSISQRLEREGAFIPGLRPGSATASHIDRTLAHLAPVGGLLLATVCMLPEAALHALGIPLSIGGLSLILLTLAALEFIDDLRRRLAPAR